MVRFTFCQMNPNNFVHSKYQLVRELGAGGSGFVWEAKRTESGQRMAIKFYKSQSECDREKSILMVILNRCGENQQMRDRFAST